MTDANWYEQMAQAMRRRDKALGAIARWTAELEEVEAEIQALRSSDVGDKQEPHFEVKFNETVTQNP